VLGHRPEPKHPIATQPSSFNEVEPTLVYLHTTRSHPLTLPTSAGAARSKRLPPTAAAACTSSCSSGPTPTPTPPPPHPTPAAHAHPPNLCWCCQVEPPAANSSGRLHLQLLQPSLQCRSLLPECILAQTHALGLHRLEHTHQRHLYGRQGWQHTLTLHSRQQQQQQQ
jgi:hypothetical protein